MGVLGDGYAPISDYALISDCHSAALVSADGSIDWCAFHRFDARPVFARLLDSKTGGYFRIAPAGLYSREREYMAETNVLETTFVTEAGTMVLTDCLPVADTSDADEPPTVHPFHQLIRVVRCTRGRVRARIEFSPRFDYGLTVPAIELLADGLLKVYGGADGLVFQTDNPLYQNGPADYVGEFDLAEGEFTCVVLTYVVPHRFNVNRMALSTILERMDTTIEFWREWSSRCIYEGPYREHVIRSALVLKGLTNSPNGAIVAAPTTSLPEEIGGVRNWDYRYCWLRDSALNLYSLFALGYTAEAHDFMGWIQRTTAGRGEDLQIMYGLGGERLLTEIELPKLDGYRSSRPVRIGNAASEQFQLDVYGELLDTAWLYHKRGGEISGHFWQFLRSVIDVVRNRWQEPDEGIWETRGGPQHFVFSKMMAWVAVDRAIRIAKATGYPADVETWKILRSQIRKAVETQGVDPKTGSYVQAFGSSALDSSTLLAPLIGFVKRDHPTVMATRDRIAAELTFDGLVHRYLSPDGLPGEEGAFAICSFWLVDVMAVTGQIEKATELFEHLLGFANDLGLLSEQIDPVAGELLGNFPQAFSHAGLVGAAMNLAAAARRKKGLAADV